MQRYFAPLALIAFLVLTVAAQQPTPTPSGEDAVRISTDLIQIDVTVTDKNGRVVGGLNAEDFEIFENGEKQAISHFSFISKTAGGVSAADAPAAGQGQINPVTTLKRSDVRRTIAIVLDDLNLSFGSVYYTRKALKRFVDEQMDPNDLVAIIRTGGGVGALQQFTSDKRMLHAAIDKIRWNPRGAGGFDSLTSVGQSPEDITDRFKTESDLVASKAGQDDSNRKSILTRENVSDKKRTDYNVSKNAGEQEEGIFAQASLGTIRYIIGGMDELPGRKVMMLFSDGLLIGNDSNKSRGGAVYTYLQNLVDYANRSSVVVYTFDTKGMRSMSIGASDSTYEIIDGHRGSKERERLDDFKKSQDGLVYVAEQTGGKALLNSDNLNGGIGRALEEQAGYYLLAYLPNEETFNAEKRRFNKLEVKVRRPGLNVTHRSGFFNIDSNTAAKPQLSVDQTIAKALMSPFAHSDIALEMNALYANDEKDGPYIRSFLHIDAKSLTFTDDPEGWKKATFDVSAVTFGDNGMPVENTGSKYTIKTKGATYQTMLDRGFVYVLIMPVKKPGLYQYRVALRDADSGKIGSASQIVEVPDLSKRKMVLSSPAVEDVSMATWQNIAQGKIGNGPGQIKVASTLLYDTVLKQFPAGTVLRYGLEIYNVRSGKQTLETQARIFQNDRVVVEGNVNKLNPPEQPSPIRRLSGAIMLKDTLQPGDYVLHLTVRDDSSKQAATQILPFEIVKWK